MNIRSESPDTSPPPPGLLRRWLMSLGLRVAAMVTLLATSGQAAPFDPPIITTQPASQTITSGASANLSVTASGDPAPTYQWYLGLKGDVSSPISGATTSTFTTPALTLSTSYWVRATNSQGTADSDTATIHVTMELATQAVDGLTASTAVLHGLVNPHDSAMVYFEYGLTNSYGNRTASQEVSGSLTISVTDTSVFLTSGATYHFRLVGVSGGITAYGNDLTFTVPAAAPVAVTGNPVGVSGSGATLLGAVNPNGLAAQVRFIYGLTLLYGSSTPTRAIAAGSSLVNVLEPISGLIPGATYHYCIIATTAAGITQGTDVSFVATSSGSATGLPTAAPDVTTGGTAAVTMATAELLGTVNPFGGTTVARFEYGMTTSYGQTTASQGVGNGNSPVALSLLAEGLLPGTHYHFRLLGSNSLGTTAGADAEFTTAAAAPAVVTGTASVINTTSATVTGTVRARALNALVFVDYGTTPTTLSDSIAAVPATVTGEATTAVSATLTRLIQGTTYYYQVRAVNAGGTARGEILTFDVGVLSGLFHWFPDPIALADRQGSVTVIQTPSTIVGGWRFEGEWDWRASGSSATGLTTGDRVIEYRVVPGYLPIPDEIVPVTSSTVGMVLVRGYTVSGATGSGSLTVTLQPADLTGAQWRFTGESDAQWKNSEFTVTGLAPGDYGIECKAVAGRTTPPPATASVAAGKTTLATMIYDLAENPLGTPPDVLTFDLVSNQQDMPYAYVGQITSDAGCGTGFVVRSRVVATAGHVVFDDVTLAATTGLRWYFQRQKGVHEPLAKTPRGYYLLSGYADQRMAENTPGTSTPQSQNLDAAALYFLDDPGRGGYSGYLASDATPNEFMVSTAMKTLVGYPLDGIVQTNQGCMHATPLASVAFAPAYGQTYTTTQIRSSGGNSGGPLCVQDSSGVYYPAAIYLGGSSRMVVRAIDSAVVALFESAEVIVFPVPVFTLQPVASKEVQYGMQTTLTALASISMTADTTLRYQWYEGASGDVSKPVAGATTPTFTTPPITQNTMYWVRAISDNRDTSADSTATTITVLSSSNADLSNLTPSQGVLSPAFNPGIHSYAVSVPYCASISVRPEALVAQSSITVNGLAVPSGSFSTPIPLTGNSTQIGLTVTSGDRTMVGNYMITVTRTPPPATVTTLAATNVTQFSATLNGSVVPNGTVSAYFQYYGPVDTTNKTTSIQILSGTTAVPVQAALSGLSDAGVYHYHLVVVAGTVMFTGNDLTFTISKLPAVATGTPIVTGATGNNKVTLVGTVNPMGLPIHVHFEYGSNPSLDTSTPTPTQIITAGSGLMNVFADVSTLLPGFTYFYRIVADGFTGGPVQGSTVGFQVTPGGVVTPFAPEATTGATSDITVSSVTLQGQVNPKGASTFAYFEYGVVGQTPDYGSTTLREDKGNGSSTISVTQSATGLLPGTTYHFRCVAENSIAVVKGEALFFTTNCLPPLAATGTAEALNSTSVKVHGTVQARGATTTVVFEYGTDDVTFPYSSTAMESPVTGDVATPVSAVLTNLAGDTTYYFRVKASSPGGTVYGVAATLQPNALLGYVQHFTAAVAATDYQGQVQVILQPSRGGWRFVGETQWRASGATAMGLTTGDRQIEYQPLTGLIQPPSETVGVVSGDPPVVLNRFYYESAVVGDLRVILKPDAIAAQWRMIGDVSAAWRNSGDDITGIWPGSYVVECKEIAGFSTPALVTIMVQAGKTSLATLTYSDQGGNPPPVLDYLSGTAGVGDLNVLLQPSAAVANGAQWRVAGDANAAWRNSGASMAGILPGSYLIECKNLPGRTTPVPVKVMVVAGRTTTATITYFTAMDTTASLQPISFTTASTSQDLAYAYVGMLRSGTGGSYTGFVVKPQVVATVAQAVFDEATLTATTDLQWLLQRDQAQFEPVPQVPRGFYVFTGYAAQRATEGTPGTLAVQSQNLDVAALYFDQPAGRGGFSGFLATTTATATTNEYLQSSSSKTLVGYPLKGILAANAGQMHTTSPVTAPFILASGQTYTNPFIQGVEGMLGGPLCVQYGGGTYYPAGIYVGGATGNAVRAIDSETTTLFANAALSANGGVNNTGGGITHSSFSIIGSPSDPGAIKVTIEPAGARTAGAGWRLSPEVTYRSSGTQKNGLAAGYYVLQLRTVTGYQDPAPESVQVIAGQLHEITYTYQEDYTPLELWRLAHFGTVSNTGNAADSADPDGDGCPNIHEYTTGTDPNDAHEATRILTTTKGISAFTVTASGRTTRTYVLERTADPNTGPWSGVDTVGPLGADGTVTLTDSSAPAGSAYYRIRVEMP